MREYDLVIPGPKVPFLSTSFIRERARLIGSLLFAAIVAAVVAACAGVTPQQKVFELTAVYNAVLAPIVEYESLPRCAPDDEPTAVCSKPDVVSAIRKADKAAFAALNGAQAVVREPSSSEGEVNFALNAAEEAILRFRKVARDFKLIGG